MVEDKRPYTPFEDCPHDWCVGCGTCHTCERENPPVRIAPTRRSTVKSVAIPPRAPAQNPASAQLPITEYNRNQREELQ